MQGNCLIRRVNSRQVNTMQVLTLAPALILTFVIFAVFLAVSGAAMAGDFSEYRLRALKEDQGSTCMLEGVQLHVAVVPPQEEGWASEIYFWFETDPDSPCSHGENPGVQVFTAALEPVFSAYLTEETRYCRNLYFNPGASQVVLEVGTGIVGTYILTDMADVRSFEATGIGPCIWLDPHRFVFTRFENKARGIPAEVDGRFSVEVYEPAGPGSFPLKKATALSNFILQAVDGTEIVIEEQYVDAVEDWKDFGKVKSREIRVPIPAAG